MSGNLSQGFPWIFFLCLIQASGGSERKRCETQNLHEEWLMRWVNISPPRCAEGSVCMMVGSSSARVNRETQRIEKCNIALLHPTGDPRVARISIFFIPIMVPLGQSEVELFVWFDGQRSKWRGPSLIQHYMWVHHANIFYCRKNQWTFPHVGKVFIWLRSTGCYRDF